MASSMLPCTAAVAGTVAVAKLVSESETERPAAQILLIQAATVAAAPAAASPAPAAVPSVTHPTAPATPAPVPTHPTPQSSPSTQVAAGSIIYSQRLPPGRLPHVQPPVLCPETRSRVIIEAIDALRGRKARPDETRITHWVNRRSVSSCPLFALFVALLLLRL